MIVVSRGHVKVLEKTLTLVALLLALYPGGQILVWLPVDLLALGVVVDEVATISILFLVIVCL